MVLECKPRQLAHRASTLGRKAPLSCRKVCRKQTDGRCSADKTFVHGIKSCSVFWLSGVEWGGGEAFSILSRWHSPLVIIKYFKSGRDVHPISHFKLWGDPLLRACQQPRLADALSSLPSLDFSALHFSARSHPGSRHCSAVDLRAHCRPLSVSGVSVQHSERTIYADEG